MTELNVHFGFNEKGEPISIPLFQMFFDATTGHGKTLGTKSLLWRFHLAYPDWKILIIDSKDKRDYADFNADIPICFVQTTEPLDLKNLLEPLVGASMMYYLDKIIEEAVFDTLGEMQQNIEKKIKQAEKGEIKLHGKEVGKLRVLNHLLKKLIVLVERPEITSELVLRPGFNVMPVALPGVPARLKRAFQWLIVRSVMLKLQEPQFENVLVVLDEFHKWSPQKWASLVKQIISENVSEGRGKRVFYWMADQALAKVDKEPLKPVKVWVVGQQMGRHEVKYAVETVNDVTELEIDKKDVKGLRVGSFMVVDGVNHRVEKAYLQPCGVPDELAIQIATGERSPKDADLFISKFKYVSRVQEDEDLVFKEKWEEEKARREKAEEELKVTRKEFTTQVERVSDLKAAEKIKEATKNLEAELDRVMTRNDDLGLELEQLRPLKDLRDAFIKLFPPGTILPAGPPGFEPGSPQQIGLQTVKTIVDIEDVEIKPTIKTDTTAGKILTVAKKGKLNSWRKLGDIVKAIREESWTVTSQQVNNSLNDLVKQDIIAKKHTDRNYFKVAKNVTFKD